jgi:hypothetical protein
LSVRETPEGSVPVSPSAEAGVPVVVTVNDPADPSVKVLALPLVIATGKMALALRVTPVEPGVSMPGPEKLSNELWLTVTPVTPLA